MVCGLNFVSRRRIASPLCWYFRNFHRICRTSNQLLLERKTLTRLIAIGHQIRIFGGWVNINFTTITKRRVYEKYPYCKTNNKYRKTYIFCNLKHFYIFCVDYYVLQTKRFLRRLLGRLLLLCLLLQPLLFTSRHLTVWANTRLLLFFSFQTIY